jgi:hypothetical protein
MQYRAPSDRSPPERWLLLAAFAVSCGQSANSGTSTEGGITSPSDATTPSSGGSTGSGSGGSSSGGSGGGSSSGGSAGGSRSGGSTGGGTGSSGAVSSSSGRSVTAGDAGTDDAGNDGTEAGGEGGQPAGCAGKTYRLCEDFESGAVGGIPPGWQLLQGYSTRGGVGLANDEFHSGRMSLKSDSINPGQDRVEKSLAALGSTATKHWGRIFYKVGSPAPRPNSNVLHITFTALEGTTENRVVDTVINTGGAHQWLFNIPSDKCCTQSPYDWVFDTSWHCAEWMVDVALESFRFFSDSKEVTELAFTGNAGALMSNYTNVALGTIFYQTPPTPVVVWFDDLAIDDSQIGCQ